MPGASRKNTNVFVSIANDTMLLLLLLLLQIPSKLALVALDRVAADSFYE